MRGCRNVWFLTELLKRRLKLIDTSFKHGDGGILFLGRGHGKTCRSEESRKGRLRQAKRAFTTLQPIYSIIHSFTTRLPLQNNK